MTAGARALLVPALGALVGAVALVILHHEPTALAAADAPGAGQEATPTDSALVAQLLGAVRGTSPIACELVVRTIGNGWWSQIDRQPDAVDGFPEIGRWLARRWNDSASVPRLAASLADADRCVARVASRLLGRNHDRRARAALLAALDGADARVRALAAIGLGYAEDVSAARSLVRSLEDREADVRLAAAWALGQTNDRSAVPRLTQVLTGDPDPRVRRAAALALGALR